MRQDPAPPIIYFDGFCGLCNRFVDFLLRADRSRRFRFAPVQGSTALEKLKPPPSPDPTTIVLESDGRLLEKSDAVLAIFRQLGGLWRLAGLFRLIPRAGRDRVYDWIARNRYARFGKRDTCRLPTEDERTVFLP